MSKRRLTKSPSTENSSSSSCEGPKSTPAQQALRGIPTCLPCNNSHPHQYTDDDDDSQDSIVDHETPPPRTGRLKPNPDEQLEASMCIEGFVERLRSLQQSNKRPKLSAYPVDKNKDDHRPDNIPTNMFPTIHYLINYLLQHQKVDGTSKTTCFNEEEIESAVKHFWVGGLGQGILKDLISVFSCQSNDEPSSSNSSYTHRQDSFKYPLHSLLYKGGENFLFDFNIAILNGFNVNEKDENGDAILHTAIKLRREDVVTALLLNERIDVNIRNADNKSARHVVSYLAKQFDPVARSILYALDLCQAKRCAFTIKAGCYEGCAVYSVYNGEPQPKSCNEKDSWPDFPQLLVSLEDTLAAGKNKLMLSIDGGGVMGLVELTVLKELFHEAGCQPRDVCDFIAGTSAGALIALGLLKGLTIEEMSSLFLEFSAAFQGTPKDNSEALNELLIRYLGTATFGDMIESKQQNGVIITAVNASTTMPSIDVLTNFGELSQTCLETTLVEAALKSSAAITYLNPHNSHVDGGFMCNNPTNVSSNYVFESFKQTPDIISLGSGIQPQTNVDVSSLALTTPLWKPKNYLRFGKVADFLISCCSNANGEVVQTGFNTAERTHTFYARLTPRLTKKVDLNSNDVKLLNEMRWEAKVFVSRNTDQIQRIVDKLKKRLTKRQDE